MEEFVKSLPKKISSIKSNPHCEVWVIIGNESCDLDSAVSALVSAHFKSETNPSAIVVPILNVLREELPLKTEVVHCFQTKLGLDVSDIPCRDDINLEKLTNLKLALVDHHALTGGDTSLSVKVSEIVDHHPAELLPAVSKCRIELVGSCSTLVLDEIWKINPDYNDKLALALVYWTILVDTVNLSESAKKVTPLDEEVLAKIEEHLSLGKRSRDIIFNEISEVKADLSKLTAGQLLRKDLKVIDVNSVRIAMSSVMMSVIEFSQRQNVFKDLDHFLASKSCHFSFVMGAKLDNGHLERDILIYPVRQCTQADRLTTGFLSRPELKLSTLPSPESTVIFRQGDVSFSRKKVLPLIKDIMKKIRI